MVNPHTIIFPHGKTRRTPKLMRRLETRFPKIWNTNQPLSPDTYTRQAPSSLRYQQVRKLRESRNKLTYKQANRWTNEDNRRANAAAFSRRMQKQNQRTITRQRENQAFAKASRTADEIMAIKAIPNLWTGT